MTTWFISQAPTALKWMQTNHIHFDQHLASFSSQSMAKGDTVIGALTLEQAAEVCALGASYWHLSLPKEDHEQAKLSAFDVVKNPTAPYPALQAQTVSPSTASQSQPAAAPQGFAKNPSQLWMDISNKQSVFTSTHAECS
ncbi:CRISPR-associated protein Csx16 [Pseudomonas sp. F1_0610]